MEKNIICVKYLIKISVVRPTLVGLVGGCIMMWKVEISQMRKVEIRGKKLWKWKLIIEVESGNCGRKLIKYIFIRVGIQYWNEPTIISIISSDSYYTCIRIQNSTGIGLWNFWLLSQWGMVFFWYNWSLRTPVKYYVKQPIAMETFHQMTIMFPISLSSYKANS